MRDKKPRLVKKPPLSPIAICNHLAYHPIGNATKARIAPRIGSSMGKKADILEGLGETVPALRRYARALCAGAGPAFSDEVVQSALQSVGARVRAKDLWPADSSEARIEAYGAVTALAAKRLADAPRPAPRHPPIVHGLADLAFEDRAALLLVSLEGFGYEAAARVVAAPREALLARLMRARTALAAEGLRPVGAENGARRASSHLRVVK